MKSTSIVICLLSILKVHPSISKEACLNDDGTLNTNDNCSESPSQVENEPYCGMYMAESSIPGAGLGIYTAEERNVGDKVGDGDICIPVIDLYWHNDKNEIFSFNPFYDYFWNGHAMGMSSEVDTGDIEALCPGLDCAINCNLALLNVERSIAAYDDAQLNRNVDPGVGAFSPYGNGTTYVSRFIPKGGELFKFYGDHWFTHHRRAAIFGKIPLSNDYPRATKMIKKLMQLSVATAITSKPIKNESQNQKMQDAFQEFYEDIIIKTINQGKWESRLLNALPKTVEDVHVAHSAGDVTVLHQPNAIREIDWLRRNGKCIDHIRSGPSTMKQAGHGAFAKRDLPAGVIITGSPVHHLPDYTFMNMYNISNQIDSDGKEIPNKYYRLLDEVRQMQLFYNYCFGHPESTLLLCPYGSGVNYINHNQTLANVKIQWATNMDLVHSDHMLENATIEELKLSSRPTLAFDYVATRSIKEGEELFMDYGDVWEEAWNHHVATYEPKYDSRYDVNPAMYGSARTWNTMFELLPLRTVDEQKLDPYPKNLQMRCHGALLSKRAKLSSSTSNIDYKWQGDDYGYACRILDRFIESDINETLYTIQIELKADDDIEEADESIQELPFNSKTVIWIERTDVPRSAIKYFDLPYSSDIHLSYSFRHEIQIPDTMMPEQWKNL